MDNLLKSNNNPPLISIIMPAYNAEKYIGRAIFSVLNQTYNNIELIIFDDFSTDNTCNIVEKFCDDRIYLYHEKENTGSAYLPRKHALDLCNGNIVVALDADDYLENDYIEKLFNKMVENDADVCLGKMQFVDGSGKLLSSKHSIPKPGFDFSIHLTGREAFHYTIPKWKIGMNGCMALKECWQYGFNRTEKNCRRYIHDDENVSRFLLLHASKVVFCESLLFYTINTDSITHIFNKRILDWMKSEDDLLKWIENDFGKNSKEYRAVELDYFNCYFQSFIHFIKSSDDLDEYDCDYYIDRFNRWHKKINWKENSNYLNCISYIINKNFYIECLFYFFRSKKIKLFFDLLKKVIICIFYKIKNNKLYNWYFLRKKRGKIIYNDLKKGYIENSNYKYPKYVINVFDGNVKGGGLADRLRGILSTYSVCKENNIPYKLYFKHPFDLEMFLECSDYNWHVENQNVCKNLKECEIVILDATDDSSYQYKMQKKYLYKKLSHANKQIHVYSNAGFAYDLDYSNLFHELFKPTYSLQKSIEEQKKILGPDYISVSARFMDLLGDFNETFGYGKTLNVLEAKELVRETIEQIELIHEKYPNKKILVNSDSISFLKSVESLSYTYYIPGHITHIDNEKTNDNYERYEKTFLDFLMIAEASEIYLLKGFKMYKSGYPFAASKINQKPFRIIEY